MNDTQCQSTKPGVTYAAPPPSDDSPQRDVTAAGSAPKVQDIKLPSYASMHPGETAVRAALAKLRPQN